MHVHMYTLYICTYMLTVQYYRIGAKLYLNLKLGLAWLMLTFKAVHSVNEHTCT